LFMEVVGDIASLAECARARKMIPATWDARHINKATSALEMREVALRAQ